MGRIHRRKGGKTMNNIKRKKDKIKEKGGDFKCLKK